MDHNTLNPLAEAGAGFPPRRKASRVDTQEVLLNAHADASLKEEGLRFNDGPSSAAVARLASPHF